MSIAPTPEPPYTAVVFTSLRTDGDRGYAAMAERMDRLAAEQPGYLGIEAARDADGLGITVSYWGRRRRRSRLEAGRGAPGRPAPRPRGLVRRLPRPGRHRRTCVRPRDALVSSDTPVSPRFPA
jgi:hypothetical protein